MTERVLVDTKHLILKALFISFAWHSLVLSLFTFTFRPYAVSHKPLLVFFGSILRKNDVLVTYREIPLYGVDKIPPSTHPIELPRDTNQISQFSPLQKPSAGRLEDKNLKQPFKPPLENFDIKETQSKDEGGAELDIPVPPRVPLRLHQNDPN